MATKNYKSNPLIVWSNYNLNLEDWIDGIKENLNINEIDYSDWSESMFYQEMVNLNDMYL